MVSVRTALSRPRPVPNNIHARGPYQTTWVGFWQRLVPRLVILSGAKFPPPVILSGAKNLPPPVILSGAKNSHRLSF